jgi:NADPH:quinone reductase-like Zn-dependent oxidoreductase
MLVTKKLNFALVGEPAPAVPTLPAAPLVTPPVPVPLPEPAMPAEPATDELPPIDALAPAAPIAGPLPPVEALAAPEPALPTLAAPADVEPAAPLVGVSEVPLQAGAPRKNKRHRGTTVDLRAFGMLTTKCVARVTKSIIGIRNIFEDRLGLRFHTVAMRQVWITKAGAPKVLQVREAPDPAPKAGELRIRVRASGINFADLMARVGLYPDAPKLPCVVGYEVSGVVDALGEGTTGFSIGDRVLAMCHFGGYSDVVTVPSSQALKMPERMSFESGAAFPVVYLTAHDTMLFTGHLRRKSSVLILSAAGGVGLAAIQIAKTRECTIFGSASVSKHEFLKQQGCHHVLDSSRDFAEQARAIVGTRGIDLILDPVGGKSWTRAYELLAPCGRLVAFGLSAVATGTTRNWLAAAASVLSVKSWSPMQLMSDNKTVSGTNMARLFARPDLVEPQLAELMQMYERGELEPHVDRTFPFAEASAAHQYIHDRKARGKVLLVP